MKPDQIRYSLLCNEDGGILDDVLVYGTSISARPMMVVVNASNRAKIVDWLNRQIAKLGRASTSPERWVIGFDNTRDTAMIAVQGPKAVDVLKPLVESGRRTPPPDLRNMRYYHYSHEYFDGIISRTGYTGEDGFEIICDASHALQIWEEIVRAAEAVGGMAAGLGARDTLRLEAAMPLYGHELSEAINPIQAGLNFAVNLNGPRVHRPRRARAIRRRQRSTGARRPASSMASACRGKAAPCCRAARSSAKSPAARSRRRSSDRSPWPTSGQPPQAVGTQLAVDIRGTQHPAVVVPLPFYERTKKN